MLTKLHALKRSALDLRKNGYTSKSFLQLEKAADFIDIEVRFHNKHEEEALFTLIERYVDGPTTALRDDHIHMGRINRKLRRSISIIKDHNDDAVALDELCSFSEEIVQLMVNHIHKENQILFPMIQRFCTKDELREVAKKLLQDDH